MVMSAFSVFVVALAAVMVFVTAFQHYKRKITTSWALFWGGLWVLGALTVTFVGVVDDLGRYLINGDGRWLIVYLAIILLFFICYRLFLVVQRLNESISRLVEEIAKRK